MRSAGLATRADCSFVESDLADAIADRVAALSERGYVWPRPPKCKLP